MILDLTTSDEGCAWRSEECQRITQEVAARFNEAASSITPTGPTRFKEGITARWNVGPAFDDWAGDWAEVRSDAVKGLSDQLILAFATRGAGVEPDGFQSREWLEGDWDEKSDRLDVKGWVISIKLKTRDSAPVLS